VATGRYVAQFLPTPSLVLEYGRDGGRDVVTAERLKEQVW
jgi:hypothetical protein